MGEGVIHQLQPGGKSRVRAASILLQPRWYFAYYASESQGSLSSTNTGTGIAKYVRQRGVMMATCFSTQFPCLSNLLYCSRQNTNGLSWSQSHRFKFFSFALCLGQPPCQAPSPEPLFRLSTSETPSPLLQSCLVFSVKKTC